MINHIIRDDYLQTIDNLYSAFKNSGIPTPLEKAIEAATSKVKTTYAIVDSTPLEGLALEAYAKYGSISIQKGEVMSSKDNKPWFGDTHPTYSYFWPRYEKYLKDIKGWSMDTIYSIDETTNEVIRNLANPKGTDPFDKRGLVLGYVQSGKTANFTGLINKGFDLGFKLVIVLAGMHNDLRSQTQLRLEREVVGTVDPITSEKIGVAQIRTDGTQIETWTTVQDDISSSNAIGIKNLDKPVLLVVKKQKDVLERLIELLKASMNLSGDNPPTLIVDDEADQASIDASTKTKDGPTKINHSIRELLGLFNRKAYVGYTATPFANLLIRADVNHINIGKDLYPKDFVIALPKPEGYCGPDEYFNTTGFEEDNKPLFIRPLSSEDIELLDRLRIKDDADLFNQVPNTMQEAILAFLLATAIRKLRGQTDHNSMLIHTSRLTDVQNSMKITINDFYKKLSNDILYNLNSEYIPKLQELYSTDFLEVQSSMDSTSKFEEYSWEQIYKQLKLVAAKVEVMEINGESEDALEYDKYKESGLYVIAIGGNKLSRGLTLEGLTVSYYYRTTSMYDTLMQMGRWFGYRTGYMDLCRIYTSQEIAENFEHLAKVMSELRHEFEKLSKDGLTPEEYAIKMLTHPTMSVTSPNKMSTAEVPIIYSGTMQQTRLFDGNKDFFEKNMKATVEFINSIEQTFIVDRTGTTYHLAEGVSSELVVDYLYNYKTTSSARIVNSKKIADYIKNNNKEKYLTNFNVVIVDITKATLNSEKAKAQNITPWKVNLGKIQIEGAVLRSIGQDKSKLTNLVDLGAIVAADQKNIDLKLLGLPKEKRNKPLLLIYPLHPGVKPFEKLNITFTAELVPIGIAIVFPEDLINDEGIVKTYNEQNEKYIYNSSIGGTNHD